MDKKRSPLVTNRVIGGEDMAAIMRNCDKREWWLWSSAALVTLLLTLGMASFALPAIVSGIDSFSTFFLDSAVWGLLGLVVIFNVYVIYEQMQLFHIRQGFVDTLHKLAVADFVTGLFNRRYIEHQLVYEIARCTRQGVSLTVILFDLDAFKQVNDQYGHAVGDDVLRRFAEQLQKATRGSDVVARYGGDEFLVLLPECEPDGVESVLGRLNRGLTATPEHPWLIRYSAGWTDYNLGESPREFLKRADEVLYANKRQTQRSIESSTDVTYPARSL
jgi:diguanylate cyclase (GGDEF)-like protein